MMHWRILLVIAALLALMTGAALYYRALYLEAEQARQRFQAQAEAQHAALAQVNRQMQTVAALDWQHTRELEHDKNRIAQLERDVAAGRRQVQVRANCPNVPASGSAARCDYFTLRQRIERANRQINGLQDYVRQVCLRTQEQP